MCEFYNKAVTVSVAYTLTGKSKLLVATSIMQAICIVEQAC